jgi:hypothetical protein
VSRLRYALAMLLIYGASIAIMFWLAFEAQQWIARQIAN